LLYYDLYEGVSWAGGYGDNYNGNNQEATAEALLVELGHSFVKTELI